MGSERWCAFLSGRCPAGLEWGVLAGEGLSRTCVAPSESPDAALGPDVDAPLPADGPRFEADADVTPPTTNLTGKPSAISGPDVTFMFDANEPAQFECALDGAPFGGCTSPKGYTGLAALPNPHRFQIRARDLSGNLEDPPVEYSWEVDPTALDTNLTGTPTATSGPSVTFTFTSTRPGTFECKLDPIETAFAACSSPKTYTGLTDDHDPHTFNVRAIDNAMNVDASPATYRWNVDSTGPTPTISSPTGTVGPQPTLVFQTEVGGKYMCHVDSLPEGDCTSGMKLSALSAGAHVVYVHGSDALGNEGAEQSSAFSVDNVGPTFTSLSAPTEDGTTDTSLDITYTLSDGSLTTCQIDGAQLPGCLSPIHVTNLSIARHSLTLVATDAYGNTTTVTRGWVVPPVSNMQDAEIVLGQAGDFTTNDKNHGGVSGDSFSTPFGIAASSNGFLVGDQENCRALFWIQAPVVDLSAARAIGQPDLMTATCPAPLDRAGDNMNATGLLMAVLSDRVFLSDSNNSRVLVFGIPVGANKPMATVVLGQSSFTTASPGTAANQMTGQLGVWSDGTHLAVADTGNNRILVWDQLPSSNGQAADFELGWPAFDQTSTTALSPPTRQSLSQPFGVTSDGNHFVVTDTMNHRVLIWNHFPTSAASAPDLVLGQSTFTTAAIGSSRSSFNTPYASLIHESSLFVVDRNNRRILVWTPIPTSNGEAPHAVLGATTIDALPPATGARNAFFGPRGVVVVGGRLFVTDGNRVLAFTLKD